MAKLQQVMKTETAEIPINTLSAWA